MVNNDAALPLFTRLHKVSYLFDKTADRALKEQFAISFTQYHILISVQLGNCSQSSIAAYWDVSSAAISKQVEGLHTRGLLIQVQNNGNRRENILSITPEGERLFWDATAILAEAFEETSKSISAEETTILEHIIDKLLIELGKRTNLEGAALL